MPRLSTILLVLTALSAPILNVSAQRQTAQPIKQFDQSDFCKATGQKNADGTQIREGSCSSTPQGAVPSVDRMTSTVIVNPKNAATLQANQDMTVTIALANLDTGFFADPQKDYYKQPQTLNNGGIIEGHSHVTIQSIDAKTPADATKFVFFKGLNDQSQDGKTLSVVVPKGTFKTNGLHRICTMAGANAHQPLIMPVAQRGAQDDCIRVTVQGA